MTDTIRVILLSIVAIGMFVIGYIVGRLEP